VIIEAAPGGTLPDRLRARVGDVLHRLGIKREAMVGEMAAMQDVVFAKTASKSALGSLNDFTHALDIYLEEGEMNLLDIALRLAKTPCSPIDYESPRARTVAVMQAGAP